MLSLPLLAGVSNTKTPQGWGASVPACTKKLAQPGRTWHWEHHSLRYCCRTGATQDSSRGPSTFSMVASLVTSYTTQTTLACKREAAMGGE